MISNINTYLKLSADQRRIAELESENRILRQCQVAELKAENWNLKYPVGTHVKLRMDDGEEKETKTRTAAYVCESGYAVCFFEGVSGYYLIDRATAM